MWPDQLHLPHTDDLDPMLPSLPIGPPAGMWVPTPSQVCPSEAQGLLFLLNRLSSQEPLLGQTQPPWSILPGAKTGLAGGEASLGAEAGFTSV